MPLGIWAGDIRRQMGFAHHLRPGGETGAVRYSELRREMGNITDAVLASVLKELIASGMVLRKAYDEIPPRVEYSLTPKGLSVVPILQSICQWAGAFYKEESDQTMIQCSKCDYR